MGFMTKIKAHYTVVSANDFKFKFRTEDGYIFYVLRNGKVVDSLDPEKEDMSWDSFDDFKKTEIEYTIIK